LKVLRNALFWAKFLEMRIRETKSAGNVWFATVFPIYYAVRIHRRYRVLALPLFLYFLSPTYLLAQESEIDLITKGIDVDSVGLKSPDAVLLPIPIVNPTIGIGMAAAGGLLYQLDNDTPSSYSGIGGFYTDSGSWGIGIAQKTYLIEDMLRINASAGYGRVRLDFFGIGSGAGDQGLALPIEQAGYFFVPEVLYRIWDKLYFGLGFRYVDLETTIHDTGNHPSIPELQLDVVTSGVRLLAQYDARDNALNPHTGTLLELNSNFARRSLGGTFSYEQYSVSYNKYFSIAENKTFAMRVVLCHTSNAVPFFDLCTFGRESDLRGYITGQYRDRNLVATQAEYRWQFYERFGLVAFAGVGGVAPEIDGFDTGSLLPSAGLGLRFMASEEHDTNIGIDFAFGRESQALYFRIGEAF
jgi:hypothetical protein